MNRYRQANHDDIGDKHNTTDPLSAKKVVDYEFL